MHVFTLILTICLLVVIVTGENPVCYDDVGCFPTGEPWTTLMRPVPPPQGPDIVKLFFILYTRQNFNIPFLMFGDTEWSVEGSYYDRQKPTIVFIHGWGSSANETWTDSTKDGVLKLMDANVILVDYGSIRNENYIQSVANTRIIGALVAKFLNYLIHDKGATPSNFHLVGFSLGAHISGYVGKRIPGIGRITGLDAAQPYFEGQGVEVRLDKGDAIFVDVAHTNGSPTVPLIGFGFMSSIGHVDFYFNGGWDQPGCTENMVGQVINERVNLPNAWENRFFCPHKRAVTYFIEAMLNPSCTFWAVKRSPLNAFLRVLTGGWLSQFLTTLKSCTIEKCIPFGERTIDFPARGSFDIATATSPPYCINSTTVDNLMDGNLKKYEMSSKS